jgi:hypothetical protein
MSLEDFFIFGGFVETYDESGCFCAGPKSQQGAKKIVEVNHER